MTKLSKVNNILLYGKLASLPDDLKEEAGNFIDFLTNKSKKKLAHVKPSLVAEKICLLLSQILMSPLKTSKDIWIKCNSFYWVPILSFGLLTATKSFLQKPAIQLMETIKTELVL